MMMRKMGFQLARPKRFAPEAYGDFPIVENARIAEARERNRKEMECEEWEVIEDVLDH